MDDKNKSTLMYGTATFIRSRLWGLISYITMRHHKLDLIQLAVPHTNVGFLIIYNVQELIKPSTHHNVSLISEYSSTFIIGSHVL